MFFEKNQLCDAPGLPQTCQSHVPNSMTLTSTAQPSPCQHPTHGQVGGQQGLQPQRIEEPGRGAGSRLPPRTQPQLSATRRLPSSWGLLVDNARVFPPLQSLLLSGLAGVRGGRWGEGLTPLLSPLVPTSPGGTPRTWPPVPPGPFGHGQRRGPQGSYLCPQ